MAFRIRPCARSFTPSWRTIINVTDVALDAQAVLDKVIERVEVDVGEELAGLIADGDAASPLAGRKKVVAGEARQEFFLRIAVVDDLTDQPQHVRVFDLASHQRFQDFVHTVRATRSASWFLSLQVIDQEFFLRIAVVDDLTDQPCSTSTRGR
jgi:hypothetical protein